MQNTNCKARRRTNNPIFVANDFTVKLTLLLLTKNHDN